MKSVKFFFKVNTFIVVTYVYIKAVEAVMDWNLFAGGISSIVFLAIASAIFYGMCNVLNKRYNEEKENRKR